MAIILLAVLMLAGIIVDISRISVGKSMVKRAADTAAKSILADYGSKLKENYGMFALPQTDAEQLQTKFEEYMCDNLSISNGEEFYRNRIDLFDFRIEDISITPMYNLSENSVTKQQILEYMKYRAPSELAEGFWERLKTIKGFEKMSEAYKKKLGIDKLMGRLDESQQKLKKFIDGTGDTIGKYVNGFNRNGKWLEIFDNYNDLSDRIKSINSSISSINEEIGSLTEQLNIQLQAEQEARLNDIGAGNEGNSRNESDSIREQLSELREELSSMYSESSNVKQQMNQLIGVLRGDMTYDYCEANNNALNEIQQIIEKGKKAGSAINELKSYINSASSGDEGDLPTDFKEQIQNEIKELEEMILEGNRAENMLNDVTNNESLLNSIISKLDSASGNYECSLPEELISMVESYKDISYDYSKPKKEDDADDPRDGLTKKIREYLSEKVLNDVNYEDKGISREDLPSFTKILTQSFESDDSAFLNEHETDNTEGGGKASNYYSDIGDIDVESELKNNESSFQENALSLISGICSSISKNAAALRDNIYINEYIMGTFKNSVPEIKQGDETKKDMNLHGEGKADIDTFYDSEVEYILHGNASQNLNKALTKGELLLFRFGMDTMHVFTDASKKAKADSIAAAVAGWWTGGAGIPIISSLIMAGWGMGEAIIDVKDLMDGKSVPLFKQKGDWKLDIGVPSSGPKTDKSLCFNYHDYLRLFLITVNENKKLSRIEDLIQLNIGKSKSGFKVSGCNTYVRAEVTVSMKYLFITEPFISEGRKTKDDRITYKVVVYEGY
jgi:uncharacterized protein YdcH (DUF465 family)/molybdopterin converting factor small subunit/Sec-independent protein translocase protein TatA